MKQAGLNGVELESEVQGSGEPVLLIGTGPIADSFVPFFAEETLAGCYRLIRYHQRGQAGSTHCSAPVSFAEHAVDAHLLHMQRPEPVAQGVAEFLARHSMTGRD